MNGGVGLVDRRRVDLLKCQTSMLYHMLFLVKKDSGNMLLLNKSPPDKKLQAYNLVCGTSTFAETALWE